MSEVAKNFIVRFHNLPGETVKEKHRNWFDFLHQHLALRQNIDDLEYITTNLQPSDHLENILYIDYLIYFHRFSELYERLRKNEDITVRKLSQQEWFFRRAFSQVGVEDFLDNILPAMPHSLKLKILKKLPIQEQRADEFFEAVNKQYGLFLATNLLPKCTCRKIREIITTEPVRLTETQIKLIYEKDPELLCVYLEERAKHLGNSRFMNYSPVLKYVAQKDPKIFSELFNKYNFITQLGRRTTKSFVDSQKEEVLKKPEEYVHILNKPALARKLGREVVHGLIKKSSEKGCRVPWRSVIAHCPRSQQYEIYRSAHDSAYHHRLEDDTASMSEDIFQMMEEGARERYAKAKIEKENKDHYLKYVKPDYCLKKFMEKVNYMKTAERAKYVDIVTFCCVFNKDYDSFLRVAELVAVRFKNDDGTVRNAFFRNFANRERIMENFREEHWQLVMDIYATSEAKNEWIWNHLNIVANYLKYLIVNNRATAEVLQKKLQWYDVVACTNAAKTPVVFKPLMAHLIEVGLVKPDPNQELDGPRFDCMLASLCRDFNERNPKDAVEIRHHPRVTESVKKMLQTERSYVSNAIQEGLRYVVCQSRESEEIQELKRLYFKALRVFGDYKGVMWFLKNEPKTLRENFDEFLNNFAKISGLNTRKFWRLVKKHTYLELDKRAVDFCKEKLQDEFDGKSNLVRPLTTLSTPASHLAFVRTYAPASDKVDFKDDNEKELYPIREKMFRSLHLVGAPAEVLPVALEFCKGDYLRFALSPLYSCLYKLPENETRTYVDKLNENKAISVKKHAMNLSCVLYNKEVVYGCLKSATVPSLSALLKYFAKNPSTALWELIENHICDLGKNQLSEVKSALDVVVPFNYKSKFVEIVWKISDKFENRELKKTLLRKVNHETIENFDADFGLDIVKKSIFELEEANGFVADLLVHLKSEEKFGLVSRVLDNYKSGCWRDEEKRRCARRRLYEFVGALFERYMTAKKCDRRFVSEFRAVFRSVFSLSEAFEEWILVSLMTFKDATPENCAEALMDLNDVLADKYGGYALSLFAAVVSNFAFEHALKTDGDKIKLCHALLKNGRSVNDRILSLKLLPRKESPNKENYLLHQDIVKQMSEAADDIIQMEFNLFLRNSNRNKEEIM